MINKHVMLYKYVINILWQRQVSINHMNLRMLVWLSHMNFIGYAVDTF